MLNKNVVYESEDIGINPAVANFEKFDVVSSPQPEILKNLVFVCSVIKLLVASPLQNCSVNW